MKQGAERRKSKRRPIIETFSLFAVVPKKGMHRLPVHDLSNSGIGFDLDIDGENLADFPIKTGEKLEVHLYLNQSLYLPLTVEAMRIEDSPTARRIGAEVVDPQSAGFKAFASFVQMLDLLAEAGQIAE